MNTSVARFLNNFLWVGVAYGGFVLSLKTTWWLMNTLGL